MGLVAGLGDVSDHGGVIVSASACVAADGMMAAVTGDFHACPIEGHGTTPMVSTSLVTVNGLGVIRAGQDFAGCGAMIVSGSTNVWAT